MTRTTIRLDSLAKPLAAYARKHGLGIAQAARRLIAAGLGIAEPDVKPGNGSRDPADVKKWSRSANAARWNSNTKEKP